MSGINIPFGSPLAAKVYGVAVFSAVQSMPGFMNLLSDGAPNLANAVKKLKGQTSAGYPIVKVMDLKQSAGDRVSADLFNIPTGKPVMGDQKLTGKGMSMTASSMDIVINRSRGMADTGGKMAEKRTRHNLRQVIKGGLEGWANRLEDQRCLVALAGARGSQSTYDWVVPVQSDSDFSSIMVNPVQAPTFNRRFFAMYTGTGITPPSTIASLTNNGFLTLSEIDAIGSLLKESNVPLQPVIYKDDQYGWNTPFWVMFVTERQWNILKTIAGSRWQSALQNAVKRFDGQKHPLFMGESIMWNGILVKPMGRYAIRFNAGDSVQENSSTNVESAATAAVSTDRAIILGAQALIKAYGSEQTSEFSYSWNEELTDHKSVVEVSLSMMDGVAKTRFTVNGTVTDHGVAVVDSFAPAQGTAAFNTVVQNAVGKY